MQSAAQMSYYFSRIASLDDSKVIIPLSPPPLHNEHIMCQPAKLLPFQEPSHKIKQVEMSQVREMAEYSLTNPPISLIQSKKCEPRISSSSRNRTRIGEGHEEII